MHNAYVWALRQQAFLNVLEQYICSCNYTISYIVNINPLEMANYGTDHTVIYIILTTNYYK